MGEKHALTAACMLYAYHIPGIFRSHMHVVGKLNICTKRMTAHTRIHEDSIRKGDTDFDLLSIVSKCRQLRHASILFSEKYFIIDATLLNMDISYFK